MCTHLNDSAIFDDNKDQVQEPIVQCVQIKPLPPQPGHQERYRAVFSDIANYVQTMLASRMWIIDLCRPSNNPGTDRNSRG